jgi:hypothetical protein
LISYEYVPIFSVSVKHFFVGTFYFLNINTTGATGGAGTAHPSGAPEFTPGL